MKVTVKLVLLIYLNAVKRSGLFFNVVCFHFQEEAFENKSKMRRPLPGLPDVLAASTNKEEDKAKDPDQPQPPQTIYRVFGGRKHVQVPML